MHAVVRTVSAAVPLVYCTIIPRGFVSGVCPGCVCSLNFVRVTAFCEDAVLAVIKKLKIIKR
jgi:hypothetical protein